MPVVDTMRRGFVNRLKEGGKKDSEGLVSEEEFKTLHRRYSNLSYPIIIFTGGLVFPRRRALVRMGGATNNGRVSEIWMIII